MTNLEASNYAFWYEIGGSDFLTSYSFRGYDTMDEADRAAYSAGYKETQLRLMLEGNDDRKD